MIFSGTPLRRISSASVTHSVSMVAGITRSKVSVILATFSMVYGMQKSLRTAVVDLLDEVAIAP